ncbi:pentatricopeptide repeat-containing protein At2g39620 [Amborella trichopoda]|uniref:pentatricopeptide repeat-containing protein At2g39620 n=1 Tax=Amborella trichopoda TaxID=13333 RepID=UPI0005D41358|nr:pentatricopeptide repeat-containing protein At2g39620 [Amborella trichopoda]|eukprot:XP_011624817.1 pentatricopeptide repeat-containing protein At2g39620 [Amborella trichopoda]
MTLYPRYFGTNPLPMHTYLCIRHGFLRRFSFPATVKIAIDKPVSCSEQYYYTNLLSSCKNLSSLKQIHGRLIALGLESDHSLEAKLLNLYSVYHGSVGGRLIFDFSKTPTVILWNSMIKVYNKSNLYREALVLYTDMLKQAIEPDNYTFPFVLKACTGSLCLEMGFSLHGEVVKRGFGLDGYICTGLIDMYCKFGYTEFAREVFNKMSERDVVAWNAMISGYSQVGDPKEALKVFREMQMVGIEANSVSLLNLFPSVCWLSSLVLCKCLHCFAIKREFELSVFNGLIDLYAKCGNVEASRRIFDRLLKRDDVSWGSLISAYSQNGYSVEALEIFGVLKRDKVRLNQVQIVGALLAATDLRDIEKGKEIHDYLIQRGTSLDIEVSTTLITMYAKCGNLNLAKELFNGIENGDLVAWSAMISALAHGEHPNEALQFFREMQNVNLKPNRVTIVSVLPSCAEISALKLGKSIHGYVMKVDMGMGLDVSIGTALVAMYVKCGCFSHAKLWFHEMPCKDVVTWNAMVNGYAQMGHAHKAMETFRHMQSVGLKLDSSTLVGLLPSCALLKAINNGNCIHGHAIKLGFESDLHVMNATIDMYAKCGCIGHAEKLFETEFVKDEISWNTMIAGYAQNGRPKDAVSIFCWMREKEELQPNLVSIVNIIPAYAQLAALNEGKTIHSYIVKTGFFSSIIVINSLIDMYSKCGHLGMAREIFDLMPHRDMVSWNAMLSGYAIHGHGQDAIFLFSQMRENSVLFDDLSLLSVLSACRHEGLVDEGLRIFESMRYENYIEPNMEHHACMVDLLGRAGKIEEAWAFIQRMPMKPDAGVWGALLGACRIHLNVELGERALSHLVDLEPENPAHYVVLSNIHASLGRWDDAHKMRMVMHSKRLKKIPGCSWIGGEDGNGREVYLPEREEGGRSYTPYEIHSE